jgi:[ribosomal protein S5]-alanine N-acetyltransferase
MQIAAIFQPFPILRTERLVLRALRMDDLIDLYEYAADPELARFTEWDHYGSLEEAQTDLAQYVSRYERAEQPLPVWGIEHAADHKLIGICNIVRWWIEDRRAEIGYALSRRYWGQGLVPEAIQAMLDFGFEQMEINRFQATCLPVNTPSQRVMQKVGMQPEGLLHGYEIWKGQPQDLLLYAIVRDQWALTRLKALSGLEV